MNKVQMIEKDGQPEWVVIPYDDYRRLCHAAELIEDTEAYRAAKAVGGELIPHDVVKRLVAGDSPIRVYRQYRGLTQRALAERTGVAASYLSQIEAGQRSGSSKLLRRIADALDVTTDDII